MTEGDGGDRRSLGMRRGVRVSRGRTLATTERCALMPEDILEDSLACRDGSGGEGQSLARAMRLDKSGQSRITRVAETAATRSPRASIGRAAAAGRCTRIWRSISVRHIRQVIDSHADDAEHVVDEPVDLDLEQTVYVNDSQEPPSDTADQDIQQGDELLSA